MISENLLATYSLLSFIKENQSVNQNRSILQLFVPLLTETLNTMLRNNKMQPIQGRDYTEIKDAVFKQFELNIPIEAIGEILKMLQKENDNQNSFALFGDHGFIIKQSFGHSLNNEYDIQKKKIKKLERNYKAFCKRQGVEANFEELIKFIQDQKNRIFDKSSTIITEQDYHVSKYVANRIRKKDEFFDIICSIYLGGIITSYFQFSISEKVVDAELLWDTNFYISLCNLNTKESYVTCNQLYELAKNMGFTFSILERTIEQIKILITNKAKSYDNREPLSRWDEADILSACIRENISHSDLLLYKDNILKDLSEKGVNIIYDASISPIIKKAETSKDLKHLAKLRGNRRSAMNDIIAQLYVEHKRSRKEIAEFNDVNCWFLTNSFSTRKMELDLPLWQRTTITAPDLLVLLWFSNPSLKGNDSRLLSIASLSANVLKFRAERMPSSRIIDQIQQKISKLQISNKVSQETISRLCIRMCEGCIDENEAERIVTMSTKEFRNYIDEIRKQDDKAEEISEQNQGLTEENTKLKNQLIESKAKSNITKYNIRASIYTICMILLWASYVIFIYAKPFSASWIKYTILVIYLIASAIIPLMLNTSMVRDGFYSFFYPQKSYRRECDNIKKENNEIKPAT